MSEALDLSTFGFGEPLALVALVLIPLAAWVWLAGRRARRAARAALGGASALHGGVSERRRSLAGLVLVVAMGFAILAAARPQWGEGEREIAQAGIDIVIALDVSRSMEAQDVAPSRAEAASSGLAEMLSHLTGNRVGLVTFAGSAFARAPLTVDLEVLSSLIARAQSESPLVQPGTDLGAAIDAAIEVLDVEDPASARAVVLVSDGETEDEGLDRALERAERAGVPVYTVFAGTSNPTALPAESGGTDVSTANAAVLESIAERTDADARGIERIAGLAVEFRRLQQTQFDSATERQPIDRFVWFAAAALALVAVAWLIGEGGSRRMPAMRRGAIVTGLLGLSALACGTATWQHMDAGNRAYDSGDYEEALSEYRQAGDASPDDPSVDYNIANALHMLERYEEAAAAAQEAYRVAIEGEDVTTGALAQYTLGNTAYVRGQLEAARDGYVGALRLDPTDRDAKANLELVLALLAPPETPGEAQPTPTPGAPQPTAPAGTPTPGEGTPEPGDGPPQPGGTASPDGTPQPSDQPGEGQAEGDAQAVAIEAARVDLEQALGELGPEVSMEEALRILELTRRLNELQGLPSAGGGGVPPR